MMFVDESGDPGYPKDSDWSTWTASTIFVRVGVIIHGWRWRVWNKKLLEFKQRKGITWDSEVKASNIRKGEGAFVGWDKSRRDQFMHDITTLIGSNPDLTLIGVAINKKSVDTTKNTRYVKPQVRSMELLLERYNAFLNKQKDQAGIVVLDHVEEKDDDALRRFQSYLQTHSVRFRPPRIVESTFFVKSHTSNMIQVADICSNVFFHEMMYADGHAEYKAIHPRLWKQNGRIQEFGIKKWP